ncbi:MAG: hypothetical protein AB7I36_18380 [Rhodospirillaceae bacterium]
MEDTAAVTSFDALDARNARMVAEFSWPERLLYGFSKNPKDVFASGGHAKPTPQWTAATALRELIEEFPNFKSLLRGKRVLDYGCGDGFQTVAMAQGGPPSLWASISNASVSTMDSAWRAGSRMRCSPRKRTVRSISQFH